MPPDRDKGTLPRVEDLLGRLGVAAGDGESWPLEFYGPAAEALGQAQAPFLLGRPLPSYPWLSQGFLRHYSSEKQTVDPS